MLSLENLWIIILAAGDGRRLRAFTTDEDGHMIPKQYYRFDGRRSPLEHVLTRALRLASNDRIVPIVAAAHRPFWRGVLAPLPEANIQVQPEKRGTAVGVLSGLLHVLRADPWAKILVLPASQIVEDEDVLTRSLIEAIDVAGVISKEIVLIGVRPDSGDFEREWISPANHDPVPKVSALLSQPGPAHAAALLAQGALWSTGMLAASSDALLRLYRRGQPWLLGSFLSGSSLAELYPNMPGRDLHRDLLAHSIEQLRILCLPDCGWNDLSTPQRCHRYVRRLHALQLQESQNRKAKRAPMMASGSR